MGTLIKTIGGVALILVSVYLSSIGTWTLLKESRAVAAPGPPSGPLGAEHRPDSFADVVSRAGAPLPVPLCVSAGQPAVPRPLALPEDEKGLDSPLRRRV